MTEKKDGFFLFAKKRGPTSFVSLAEIKRALSEKKIGHTGTLDSFASGLLVVCAGRFTRFASHISAFDKSYEAILFFGEETDTLELTGSTIKTAPLPMKDDFLSACKKFVCSYEQTPPLFSAIHIDGKRASALMRSGERFEMPKRNVTIHSIKVFNTKENADGRLIVAHIFCKVSKGTYIRSLARDLAREAGSVAHLIALRRMSVGNFLLSDAYNANELPPFTIDEALKAQTQKMYSFQKVNDIEKGKTALHNFLLPMTERFAEQCGFEIVHLREKFFNHFLHAKKLSDELFFETSIPTNKTLAIFSERKNFLALIEKNADGWRYVFLYAR